MMVFASISAQAAPTAKQLSKRYPQLPAIQQVSPSPMTGIYQVIAGGKVFYTSADGRYFLFGDLVDMKANKNLSAAAKAKLVKSDFDRLPLNDAIKTVQGNGKRVLVVFTDPDCPFCRQLENELPKLKDVTIYRFPYPIVQLHPNAYENAVSIWCASDRQKAWDAAMMGVALPHATCSNPVYRNVELGKSLNITATPTLIARDGKRLVGAASVSAIDAWLGK